MNKSKKINISIFLFMMFFVNLSSLELTNLTTNFSDFFPDFIDKNEGVSSFRSLNLPIIKGIYSNPAFGSIQKETQFSFFHNSLIADSNIETLQYSTRLKKVPNLSLGTFASCFYVPFTEYNYFGERVASSYYSETLLALNFSYNFFAGYDFKGLAIGGTFKTAFRSIPNYTNNDSNQIITNSGLEQSALAFMGDLGIILQFNLLKYYSSKDPNFIIGITAKNLGSSITGFTKKIITDDPLPSSIETQLSYKFSKPVTLNLETNFPLNLQDFSMKFLPSFGGNVNVQFTNFLNSSLGFYLKGGNPRFNAGFEFEIKKVCFLIDYTLDLTSSFAPINQFSLSAKIKFGDKGRNELLLKIEEYFKLGLELYSKGDYQGAIEQWENALELNKRYDPAIRGIKSANAQIEMFEKIKDNLTL